MGLLEKQCKRPGVNSDMNFKCLVATILFVLSAINYAAAQTFPVGIYSGTGFSVEKNGQVIFDDSKIHSFKSTLKLTNISKDTIRFNLTVKLKPKASAPEISQSREDRFKISWTSATSGQLRNLHPTLKGDRGEFTISDDKLKIRSWIARTKTWETQYYQR